MIPLGSRSDPAPDASPGGKKILGWFKKRRWKPFPFQLEAWAAAAAGRSGLVHAPTGMGKTYAVWLPTLIEWFNDQAATPATGRKVFSKTAEPLRVLWITPLRALAADTVEALKAPVDALEIPWTVELRTGDTPASAKKRQREKMPTALVTTPESLSLLLSYPETRDAFASLRTIIVDEWHELLGTKRGVQTELCLARLRAWCPRLKTWGLSATLGNLDEALAVLVGRASPPGQEVFQSNRPGEDARPALIAGEMPKRLEITTLLPDAMERFPWGGHVGLSLLPQVLKQVEKARTTLLFTNTRWQAETWYQAVREARPEWETSGRIGIHHGSLDRDAREAVEARLRSGEIRCVVCTASLDLGVDFSPVEQVIQVGGPKGVARMLQRAGRSGHQPGATSRMTCVPANALELVEFAAVRDAIERRELESRTLLEQPLDVLVQHVVTVALGGGFDGKAFYDEVRTAYAYRDLGQEAWEWVLDFVTRGGGALKAYPQFVRVQREGDRFSVGAGLIAQFHRMSIGTITSDNAMAVKLVRGSSLGMTEESFLARLKPGDRFAFAGLSLELVRIRDMTAYVRKSKRAAGLIPSWAGGKMPLSSQLAAGVRRKLLEAHGGVFDGVEMQAARPVLEIQRRWSVIPQPDELLIESVAMKEGVHSFVFPFAGRLVHEGLAPLLAHRLTRLEPRLISLVLSDYGFGLLTEKPIALDEAGWRKLLSPDQLTEDLVACMNSAELAKRQFREIARIAGLVFQGFPGANKAARQLQASSGLFFEVFQKYDPENLLLSQARREVLERQLEVRRMREVLESIQSMRLVLRTTERLTPLAFPLWASLVQGQVSSEVWTERVKKMAAKLEEAAKA